MIPKNGLRVSKERRKEGNVLFNGALNIFYYRSYGVGRIVVKDYSDSEIGNLLPPLNMRLFFIIGVGVGGWEWERNYLRVHIH